MENDARNSQALELQIQLRSDRGIDADDIDALTRSLSEELEEISGTVDVKLAPAEEMTPEGAKAGVEMVTLGALLLAILPVAVPSLIDFLKEWALRPGSPPVTIEVKQGDKIVKVVADLKTTSVDDIARLLEATKL